MTISFIPSSKSEAPKEDHWIPLGDLMTGLMMVFLLIAVLFMLKVEADSESVKKMKETAERQASEMKRVALIYDELREQLYIELEREFRDDLPRWQAKLEKDLTIRFEAPDVQFKTNEFILQPKFMAILDDFFPRYANTVSALKYQDSIEEVRIEGHTSTKWNAQIIADAAYFKNMELSQSRTRKTLEYVLPLINDAHLRNWLKAKVTANGMSSSRLRFYTDGSENQLASQRVEFRLRTNAESRIGEILKVGQQ